MAWLLVLASIIHICQAQQPGPAAGSIVPDISLPSITVNQATSCDARTSKLSEDYTGVLLTDNAYNCDLSSWWVNQSIQPETLDSIQYTNINYISPTRNSISVDYNITRDVWKDAGSNVTGTQYGMWAMGVAVNASEALKCVNILWNNQPSTACDPNTNWAYLSCGPYRISSPLVPSQSQQLCSGTGPGANQTHLISPEKLAQLGPRGTFIVWRVNVANYTMTSGSKPFVGLIPLPPAPVAAQTAPAPSPPRPSPNAAQSMQPAMLLVVTAWLVVILLCGGTYIHA